MSLALRYYWLLKNYSNSLVYRASVLFFVFSLALFGCSKLQDPKELITKSNLPTIRLGTTQAPPSWLTHIAEFNGYFTEQGLNVDIISFKSGKRALNGLFSGKVDIATTAEGPVVFSGFNRNDFSIIATIGQSSNDNLIVARKDHGILKPADIKGKIVATQSASAAHYFLHLFILKQQLTNKSIRQSYIKINKLPQAIASGEVDAISTREPFVSQAMDLLGENGIVFEVPCLYLKTFNLVVYNSYIEKNPDTLKKFLVALLQAEKFVYENPEQSISFFESKFYISKIRIKAAFKYLDLRVVLQQSLISTMQDEADWIVNNKLIKDKQAPNYLDFIYSRPLKNAKRSAVSIFSMD